MFFAGEASSPKSRQSGDAASPGFKMKIQLLSAHQVVLHPEGNSSRNTSNLPASTNVFKRSGMFLLMRLLLSG